MKAATATETLSRLYGLAAVLSLPTASAWTAVHRPTATFRAGVCAGAIQGGRRGALSTLLFSTRDRDTQPSDSFIDAEYERINPDDHLVRDDDDPEVDYDDDLDDFVVPPVRPLVPDKTAIDASLEASEEISSVRVPFVNIVADETNYEYIDCKLAFTVNVDGTEYGIGVPFDDAVAIVTDLYDKSSDTYKTEIVNPDEPGDEGMELMEIMAKQVREQLGKELYLRKTPRVLTISGGLSKITDGWETSLIPDPIPINDLLDEKFDPRNPFGDGLDEEDKEVQEFLRVIRNDLGEEEFKKTMEEDMDPNISQEVIDMFNIPGFGTEKDKGDGIDGVMKSVIDDLKHYQDNNELESMTSFDPGDAGLKLISYKMPKSGNTYALVKILKPVPLVGRYVEPTGDTTQSDLQFELLTKTEEAMVVPKIEELAQQDLDAAGLKFRN